MVDAIFNVEATALFYDRPQPDVVELLGELNKHMSNQDGCYMSMSPLSHADWWLLSCEKFHIMITFSDEAAPHKKFQAAVTSPVTSLRRFDYSQALQSHRTHMHVEIGDGNAPLPPEARIIMQEFGSATECDPELKMKALHWTSQFIARHVGFLALHFAPSDRLFCPEELAAAMNVDFPTQLLTHPIPSMPKPGPTGVEGWSLTLRNPHHLPGRAIELEGIPVPVPLATAVQLMTTLFAARLKGKMPLNHGDILTPSKKWSLYVRHDLPTEEAPDGRVILSFWDCMGHDAPAPQAAPEQTPAELAPVAPPAGLAGKLSRKARRAAKENASTEAVEAAPVPVELAAETPMQASAPTPEPHYVEEQFDLVPTRDAQLQEQSEADAIAADLYPDEVYPQTEMPRLRDGLGTWIKARFSSTPAETRVKVMGLAIILGLPFVWNPYAEFTGGIDTLNRPQTAGFSGLSLPTPATFAALFD